MSLTVSIKSCYTRIKQHNKHQWSYTNVLKRKPSLLKHTEELWPCIHSPSLLNEDKSVLWRWHWKMAGSRANMGTMIDHESQQKVKLDDKCVHTNVHLWVWVGGFAHIWDRGCVCVCVQDMATCSAQTHYPVSKCLQIVCKSSWDFCVSREHWVWEPREDISHIKCIFCVWYLRQQII